MTESKSPFSSEQQLDLYSKALDNHRGDFRARYAAYGSRSAVLLAGAGAFIGFLSGIGEINTQKPDLFLIGSLTFAVLAAVFATISLKSADGEIIKLTELEIELHGKTEFETKDRIYRQELIVSTADEKLLEQRSKWLDKSIFMLLSSITCLALKIFVPLLAVALSFISR